MTEINYPKVLIINGEPFNQMSATGITMSALFYGWPKDKIAQVYTANISPDKKICEKNWRLKNRDLFLLSHSGDSKNTHAADAVNYIAGNIPSKSSAYFRNIISPLLDLLPYRISPDFLKCLAEFKPDLIYTMLGNIRLFRLAIYLSHELKVPVAPHFMDDWISTMYRQTLLTCLQRRVLSRKFQELLTYTHCGVTISVAMAEEYKRRYGIHFEAFMNAVSTSNEFPIKVRTNANLPVRFCYVGGLHLSRWKSLKRLIEILDDVAAECSAQIVVYAPPIDVATYGYLFKPYSVVTEIGSLLSSEVPSAMNEADVMVHVESFEKEIIKYTRLSISTKIPQYMAAGRPILALAPGEAASTQYIINSNCGVAVDIVDEKMIASILQKLILSETYREQLGREGWRKASIYHNAEFERDRLRTVLVEAAKGRTEQTSR